MNEAAAKKYPLEQLVPKDNIDRWISVYDDQARTWLGELALTVNGYAEEWGLSIEEPLEGGTASAVIGAKQRDKPVVLKIHPPWIPPAIPSALGKSSAETEAAAFRIWDGQGAPQLLANDKQALLLERIVDAKHSPDMDAAGMVELVAQISRPMSYDDITLGIPFLNNELYKRYQRAAAKNHPEISYCLLFNACSLTYYLSNIHWQAGSNFPPKLGLVHGDLKIKNILQRPDGSKVVIDPSPSMGGCLLDVTLWTIDKPEGIVERCEAVADCLGIDPQIIGNLAVALAIPEICLASPTRAVATLEYIKDIARTNNLDHYITDVLSDDNFMERV